MEAVDCHIQPCVTVATSSSAHQEFRHYQHQRNMRIHIKDNVNGASRESMGSIVSLITYIIDRVEIHRAEPALPAEHLLVLRNPQFHEHVPHRLVGRPAE
jgi:hypothetical protein